MGALREISCRVWVNTLAHKPLFTLKVRVLEICWPTLYLSTTCVQYSCNDTRAATHFKEAINCGNGVVTLWRKVSGGQTYFAPTWHCWISSVLWWITCGWPEVLVVMNLSKAIWGPTRVIAWLLSAESRHWRGVLWQNISAKRVFCQYLQVWVLFRRKKCWLSFNRSSSKHKLRLWRSVAIRDDGLLLNTPHLGCTMIMINLWATLWNDLWGNLRYCKIPDHDTHLSRLNASILKHLFAKDIAFCGKNFISCFSWKKATGSYYTAAFQTRIAVYEMQFSLVGFPSHQTEMYCIVVSQCSNCNSCIKVITFYFYLLHSIDNNRPNLN